ncbi:Stk1 family PASTA domain-containing Ser/Thr kinase [Streptomyces alkaliterrae]|uniref:non-specific serine/threonine protein kinase n=1 Tax=Streptomyces alkaliterrae TaxID=2213162 RepID=A0A5P0YN04_9ACTN|nr:Stk1 family PASTA domain-containing Ser/Thr kinase [Streptomyces alkaliterrae]MBB1253149.1 Stk1 family PASTA domain-containing Ser/Thr kinase [Streptomyces alkaliterrae]MBB1259346.1 Stk1 family PASTA domain-containing Ser/Thr kinase [Streptomyces alkaliterrae]MQS01724.1 Stk1 family PASTA domain-containing Ser/Thr kinase [Streptomyces alkaliterrae]
MDATLQDPLVGQTLDGRYRVAARIAVGGMATVYRAMDTRLDRVVALKVMHPSLAADAAFVERFIREAKSVARLAHPNVVGVFDQGTDGTYVYLAMEYIEGCTLRDLLGRRGALSPRAALDVLEPVLAALGAAHRAGLVHRDVKPENVLIGDDGRVKVADFGLARAVDAQTAASTTSVMGTVSYLAPEQIEDGSAGTPVDVYACGVMLFEALTGAKPHTGSTPAQILYSHLNRPVPPPSSRVPGLALALDGLVARATDRDPARRPADAVELLHELRSARAKLTEAELDAEPPNGEDADDTTPVATPDAEPHSASDSTPDPDSEPTRRGVKMTKGADDGVTEVIRRPLPEARAEHTSVLPPLPADPPPSRPRGPRALLEGRRRLLALVGAALLVLGIGTGVWYINSGQFTQTPSVLRLSQADAERTLTEAGLRVRVTHEFSTTIDRGLVMASDPGPGDRVRGNATVTITVSKGPELVKVPKVRDLPLAEARKRLRAAGLVPATVSRAFDDEVARGAVVSTEPKAGSELRPGRAISLVVSKGERLEVPTVTGLPEEKARETLTGTGFKVKVAAARVHSEQKPGEVARQSPDAGATGARGDTVTLTLSKGPEMVTVPDVVGKDEDEAVRLLKAAGLDVTVRRIFFTGSVFSQSVDGGEQAAKGSSITIWVR